ncbi:unnamed protein product [Chrysoparadoxa australica]
MGGAKSKGYVFGYLSDGEEITPGSGENHGVANAPSKPGATSKVSAVEDTPTPPKSPASAGSTKVGSPGSPPRNRSSGGGGGGKPRNVKGLLRKAAKQTQVTSALKAAAVKRQLRPKRINTTSTIGWICIDIVVAKGTTKKKFTTEMVLGSGLMGTIYYSKCQTDGRYCALKCVRKDSVSKTKCMHHLLSEKKALKSLTSPFIVDSFGTFQEPSFLVFVLELCPGGELFQRLMKEKRFSLDTAKFYAVEIFSALEYIHTAGFVYRDLKPENVVIDEIGHIKVCDFGFATEPGPDGWCRSNVGTPCYLGPEQLNSKKTDGYQANVVDWWAYGCLVYELLVGRTPFESDKGKQAGDESRYEIYLRVLEGKIKWPIKVPSIVQNLVKTLLEPKLEKRLIGHEAVKHHKWFQGIDWDKVEGRRLRPPWTPTLTKEGDKRYFEEHPNVSEDQVDHGSIDPSLFVGF